MDGLCMKKHRPERKFERSLRDLKSKDVYKHLRFDCAWSRHLHGLLSKPRAVPVYERDELSLYSTSSFQRGR
jgi:hypothetical protein